jgi:hypothetical protein
VLGEAGGWFTHWFTREAVFEWLPTAGQVTLPAHKVHAYC